MGTSYLNCRSGSYHRNPIRMHESAEPYDGFMFGIGGHFHPLEHAASFFLVYHMPEKDPIFMPDSCCNTSAVRAASNSPHPMTAIGLQE